MNRTEGRERLLSDLLHESIVQTKRARQDVDLMREAALAMQDRMHEALEQRDTAREVAAQRLTDLYLCRGMLRSERDSHNAFVKEMSDKLSSILGRFDK